MFDFWLECWFGLLPWMIFLTISWSLFWCFHNLSSWNVCSCELCRRFILSTLSAFTLLPGKLSTRTLSQFGVNFVGTANLKNASSHRVTSKGRGQNQDELTAVSLDVYGTNTTMKQKAEYATPPWECKLKYPSAAQCGRDQLDPYTIWRRINHWNNILFNAHMTYVCILFYLCLSLLGKWARTNLKNASLLRITSKKSENQDDLLNS